MNIRYFEDHVEIEGYVNAVERNSKTLWDRFGSFIERITKGAFTKALNKNPDVRLYLNHERDIGGQADGNLKLVEDAIGLRAEATVTDPEVMEDARSGNLVGWSFGYWDTEDGVDRRIENGMPVRVVSDMDLLEVSLLNRSCTPAFEGTLVTVRSDDGKPLLRGEDLTEEPAEEPVEDPAEETPAEETPAEPEERSEPAEGTEPAEGNTRSERESETIDYSYFDELIKSMKGEKA